MADQAFVQKPCTCGEVKALPFTIADVIDATPAARFVTHDGVAHRFDGTPCAPTDPRES
jgi:hypothetical protein